MMKWGYHKQKFQSNIPHSNTLAYRTHTHTHTPLDLTWPPDFPFTSNNNKNNNQATML